MAIESPEIEAASLHIAVPWYNHIYGVPFLTLYPLLAYAYYVKYDEWIVSEEWTFIYCVALGTTHALSFLFTKWSAAARAWITTRRARSVEEADCIRIIPKQHRGHGDIVPLEKKNGTYTFNYQRDTLYSSSWMCESSVDVDSFCFAPLSGFTACSSTKAIKLSKLRSPS